MVELLILTAVGTVVGSIAAVEASAWVPYLSRRLLGSALARLQQDLPPEVRDRWVEEIEADFAAFSDRPWGGLGFALGVRRKGARRLAAELKPRRSRLFGFRSRAKRVRRPRPEVVEYRWVQSTKISIGTSHPRYVRIPIYPKRERADDE